MKITITVDEKTLKMINERDAINHEIGRVLNENPEAEAKELPEYGELTDLNKRILKRVGGLAMRELEMKK